MLLQFPGKRLRHGRASAGSRDSILIKLSNEISGNACMISGQESRGNWLRCFHARTAPGRLPTLAAKMAGPPFSSMMDDGVGFDMRYSLPVVTLKGKSLITHGNVTVGNVGGMKDDNSWRGLKDGWTRLRWARERWQKQNDGSISTPAAAASAFGWQPGTYRAYERAPGTSKHIALDHESAQRYAQAFKVNWIWLLKGQGSPFKAELSPEQARLVAATSGWIEADIASITDMLTIIRRRSGTGG